MSQLLDIMRARYLRLPPSVKGAVAPALRILPFSVRFGGTYRKNRALISRSEVDAEFVHQYQLLAVRKLLQRALNQSRYFSRVIKACFGQDFDPSTFKLENLSALPILEKSEIIENPEDFLVATDGGYDIRLTSGTSGRPPAKIFIDRDRSVHEIAFLHHIWARIGYRLGDGRAVLRDYSGRASDSKRIWRYDPSLRELWLSPFHLTEPNIDEYLDLLHKFKVRFLFSYPSAISIVAGHALRRRWMPPRSFRGTLAASETLFSHQRQLIEKSFGVPIISHYGLSEHVGMAGEIVGSPGTYEFEPLYGIAEVVDDKDEPITVAGQRGRLVCTGLFNRSMALIRYDTGDRVTLVRPATHKNQYRLRVCDIRSKWNQEFLIGRDRQKIPVISMDQENYFGIFKEYQYLQSEPGVALFRAVPCIGITREEVERAVDTIRQRARGAIDLKLEITSELDVGLTGKRNFVLQQIPNAAD